MSDLTTPLIQEELDVVLFSDDEVDDEFVINVFRKLAESKNNDVEATITELNSHILKYLGEHLDEFFLQEVNSFSVEKCVEWAPGAYLILNDSKDENSIFMSDPMLNLILAGGEQLQWSAILANYTSNKEEIINAYATEIIPAFDEDIRVVLECIKDGLSNAEIISLEDSRESEIDSLLPQSDASNNSSPKPTL